MTMIRTRGILGKAAIWLTLLAALGLLLVMVVVPRLGGATPYTVLTGSMRPTLPPGTLVVVRPTPFDQIDVGDVVTYQLRSGERAVVTHRVIGRTLDGENRPALITQGDANSTADPDLVIEVQVAGTPWYSVPWLGHLNVAAVGERAAAGRIVAAGLLGYVAFLIVGGLRRRRSPDSSSSTRKVSA